MKKRIKKLEKELQLLKEIYELQQLIMKQEVIDIKSLPYKAPIVPYFEHLVRPDNIIYTTSGTTT